jgi:CRP/FNR family transcriptional regulator
MYDLNPSIRMSSQIVSPASFISTTLLERLKAEGTIKKFPADAVIIEENDYIKNVPIVLSGSLKVFKQDEDGREILLYYINPGESCVMSFLGAACNGTSKIRAVVEDPAEVLILPVHKAIELIRDNPAWLEFIFQLYNRRFEELLDVVNAIAFTKVDQRLLDFLKTKSKMTGSNEISITHQQVADSLGTAREVVSRLLKQLEKEGKISLSRNKITVLATM